VTGNIETGQKEGKILGCHKASEKSKGHKGHVLCLAVTSDGKFLVRRYMYYEQLFLSASVFL